LRRNTEHDRFHGDVFIKIRPMNALSVAGETAVLPFRLVGMKKTRIPFQRNTHTPSVKKIDGYGVITY